MGNLQYIDIFAGCGGLSLGLYKAGWKGVFAIEKSKDAFLTLQYNLIEKKKHFNWVEWLSQSEHDINEVLQNYKQQLKSLRGKVRLVVGGPPCQGFSMAGKRNEKDKRNSLVKSYINFIKLVKPEILLFENVHGFTISFSKNEKKYSEFVKNELIKLGYKIEFQIIDMSEFGVPQKRRRFIMVGCLKKDPKVFFERLYKNRDSFLKEKGLNLPVGVMDAIGDLGKKHGTVMSPDTKRYMAGVYGQASSSYQKLMRKGHKCKKNTAVDSHRFVEHTDDIISLHEELLRVAPRGKRITPEDKVVVNLHKRGVTVFDPNLPTPTVTSIPDDFLHYSEPRILTVRETARIQSFPDWFEFKGKYTTGGKLRKVETPRYTQVGNAIPPLFAEQVGIVLKGMLEDERTPIKI